MPRKEISPSGYYEGKAVAELLDDGWLLQLEQPFSYVDPFTVRWDVPQGCKVDGASIPKILWSVVGPPWVGKYRKASIIHDYYCDTRKRSWGAVHRVFYDAMLTSDVGPWMAKLMYAAVQWGGPRWEHRVVPPGSMQNIRPDVVGYIEALDKHLSEPSRSPKPKNEEECVYRYPFNETDLDWLKNELKTADVSDQAIPAFVDKQINARRLRRETLDYALARHRTKQTSLAFLRSMRHGALL